jgi:hypothetical protein
MSASVCGSAYGSRGREGEMLRWVCNFVCGRSEIYGAIGAICTVVYSGMLTYIFPVLWTYSSLHKEAAPYNCK